MPLLAEVEVNTELAMPDVTVPVGGAIVPSVAENATGILITGPPSGVTASEFFVISAVTVDVPPSVMELGAAVTPSTIQGSKSTPVALSQPVLPGPALQPHQLFSVLKTWVS